MNEVKFSQWIDDYTLVTYAFSDKAGTIVQGGTGTTYFSPIGNELRAAQYKIPVIYEPRLYSVTPEAFMASDPGRGVYFYRDGIVTDICFLSAITGGTKLQGGRYLFYLECTDIIGMTIGRQFKGGLWEPGDGMTVGQLIWDNLCDPYLGPMTDGDLHVKQVWLQSASTGPSFAIDEDVWNYPVDGWLPFFNDAREALRYLLQLAGAHVQGVITLSQYLQSRTLPLITNKSGGVPLEISPYDTHAGDSYKVFNRPSTVEVIEHGYIASADAETEDLFETDTSVNHALVTFDGPYHTLGGDLTIHESSASYAIVSGIGTLTGKPYYQTQRRLTKSVTGGDGVITIDNPLATYITAAGLLDRAKNYYENASIFKTAYTSPDEEGAGRYIEIEDPLGEQKRGYVSSCTMTYSGINKADTEVVAGWSPINGAIYSEQQILDASGTLEVPAGVTRMRLCLIQGGKGGFGGYKGGDATASAFGRPDDEPGDGGNPGEGGDAGKVFQIDLGMDGTAQSIAVTVGAAGAAGAADHGEGSVGGHSTAVVGGTTYTSDDGVIPPNGLRIAGLSCAAPGQIGVYAGKPGAGQGYSDEELTDIATGVTGNTTWRTGKKGGRADAPTYPGGPAYGNNGGDSGNTFAGAGADAVLDGFNGYTAPTPSYGSGGIGGNGGSGGGASVDSNISGGSGGHGSPGGPGGRGAVIALFAYGDTPAPAPAQNWLYDHNGEQLFDFYFEPLKAEE